MKKIKDWDWISIVGITSLIGSIIFFLVKIIIASFSGSILAITGLCLIIIYCIGIFFKNGKIEALSLSIIGFIIIVLMIIVYGFVLCMLFYLPFSSIDMEIDLGIIIVKGIFVRFLLLSFDCFIFYLSLKKIIKVLKKKFTKS